MDYTAWTLHLVALTWSILCMVVCGDRMMMPTNNAFHRVVNVLLASGCFIAWAVGVGCAFVFAARIGGR